MTTTTGLRTTSPDTSGETVTAVSIPTSIAPARVAGYGPLLVDQIPTGDLASFARAAAVANQRVRSLTDDQRHVWSELADGGEVDVVALTDATIAALGAAATRLGQSMARRYQRDLLLAAWRWVTEGAPLGPQPVSYATGATVVVTVHPDGRVEVETDLSEITDRHAAEACDEVTGSQSETGRVLCLVDEALTRLGDWTVRGTL